MVVLSACNTARGVQRTGDGVIGLTWALFVAGCPTQVVSQWAVDDASTDVDALGLPALVLSGGGAAAPAPLRHFNTSDGLVHNVVSAIHEDAAGYLWLGTAAVPADF